MKLNYKYFNAELVRKMQFHNMRQADTFRQLDAANQFCEEAAAAIRAHRREFDQSMGARICRDKQSTTGNTEI